MAEDTEQAQASEAQPPEDSRHRLGDEEITTASVPFSGSIKLGGFHEKLLRTIGKIPLPGRGAVRNNILFVHDARTRNERIAAAVSVNMFYGIATSGHIAFGLVGRIEQMAQDVSLLRPSNLWSGTNLAIDGAGAGLFGAIIYAHTVLTIGLDRQLIKERNLPPDTPVKAHTYTPISRTVKDVGISLGAVVGVAVVEAGTTFLATR